MRVGPARSVRRGAALVEAAVSTALFLTLVFGMIDVAGVLFRDHLVSEAARQAARTAIVHGYLSHNNSSWNTWGPTPSYYPALTSGSLYGSSTSYTVQADDPSDELAATIRPYLAGVDPSTVTVLARWPDGNNDLGNRVTVTVTAPYQSISLLVLGDRTLTLAASSTLTIAH